MNTRRWTLVILAVLLIGVAVTLHRLPSIARAVAVSRIEAMTQRPASIAAVDLRLLTGRVHVHGVRLLERDGRTPFAEVERVDARVRLPSLLLGHLWIRDLVVTRPTVRVVRLSDAAFNMSDLVRSSGDTRRRLDVTVDHFRLDGGTVTLEDQALPERRTWTSEHIEIEAYDLSTRRGDGRAVGSSVTAGAPVSVDIRKLRLYPVHLEGLVTLDGLDVTMARVYLPPTAQLTLGRGRATTSVRVALDAREGLRVDANTRLDDVTLLKRATGEVMAVVPKMTTEVADFAYRQGALRLTRLGLHGTVSVRNPAAKAGRRFAPSTVRASVSDLTWPATTPGSLEFVTTIPGGGTIALTGALRAPPASSQLRMRLAGADLAPWTQFLPLAATITGVAEGDLRTDEPLAAGIPVRVQGTIAVNALGLSNGRQTLLAARRVEASGLEVHWPTGVRVKRVLVSEPRATIERDRSGRFPLPDLLRGADAGGAATGSARAPATAVAPTVDVNEIAVRNGALAWRDETRSPAARLAVSGITGRVSGVAWPLRGPSRVHLAMSAPGGGSVRVTGRAGLDPLFTEVRVAGNGVALAPWQPYLPTTARVNGSADLDLAVTVPEGAAPRATARGTAALANVDVRDRERTLIRIQRATATGIELDWPERLAIGRIAVGAPWVLLERDDKGRLPLRTLLTASGAPPTPVAADTPSRDTAPLAVTVASVNVDRGGARIVDRAVSPAFAIDLHGLTIAVHGISTWPAKPARIDLSGQVASTGELTVAGTVAALGGPLALDLRGELRGFAVPRTNPYLLQHVGWKTTDGRLRWQFVCRVEGEELAAETDVRVSQLRLVRAAPYDGAQAHIGLPLGLITALMKDRRGDITMSFPVGGRLTDPRFDFSQAIWSAVRTVAINAITLPVSWIGRVRFTPDSRMERIEVNPVTFAPGTATPAPQGSAQAERLAAFLQQLPEVKLALTPVVSTRDLQALKQQAVDATLERLVRQERITTDAAVERVFRERFPDRPALDTQETMLAALLDAEPVPATAVPELAAQRLDAVRAVVKRAGGDVKRLAESPAVEHEGPESQVDVTVVEGDAPERSKVRRVLRRMGVPLKGAEKE